MLRVTLEATAQEAARLGIATLEILEICNDSTGTPDVGNDVWGVRDSTGEVIKHGRLLGYEREQGAWELVRCSLADMEKGR